MRHAPFRAVAPVGLIIDAATTDADGMSVAAHSAARGAACLECGRTSTHIHSRHGRRLRDLPWHGRAVHLHVQVHRFRCGNAACRRRIFGKPLADDSAARAAGRTSRLEGVVHHLGIALGGRPAASLAWRLMLPVRKDALLRVVRRLAVPLGADPVRVPGIDDFAWKRGQRYRTLLCDLERRRTIELLPDRKVGTAEARLAAHPEIPVVSRGRGRGYGPAATTAAQRDRWGRIGVATKLHQEWVRAKLARRSRSPAGRPGGRVKTGWRRAVRSSRLPPRPASGRQRTSIARLRTGPGTRSPS